MFPGAAFWVSAVILTMPVRDVALGVIGRANIRIGDLVLLAAVIVWLTASALRQRMRVQLNGLDLAMVVLVCVYAMSVFWAVANEHTWIRIFKLTRNLWMYILIVNYLRSDFDTAFRRIAIALVIAGLMQSVAFVVSMMQFGGVEAWRVILESQDLASNDTRLSVVKSGNGAGIFLRGAATWLPLCAFFGLAVLPRLRRMPSLWVGGAAWLMFVLTMLTLSRGPWLALAAAAPVVLAARGLSRSLKRVAMALPIVTLLLLAGWHEAVTNVLRSRMGTSVEQMMSDPSVVDRLDMFRLAIDSFERSPFVGGGVSGISPFEYIIVHNAYLQVLGELGVVGAVLFGWVIVKWLRYLLACRRQALRRGDDVTRTAAATMLGLAVFFLVLFLSSHDLESGEVWLAIAAASGLFTSLGRGASLRVRTRIAASPFGLDLNSAGAPS